VANGKYVHAHLVGDILLRSECGNFIVLQGVLYSPSLNKNIISAPHDEKPRLHYYHERQLRGTTVQGYQSENEYEVIGKFIYIYWKKITRTCVKIPATKYYGK
jgi:hypothetical protein